MHETLTCNDSTFYIANRKGKQKLISFTKDVQSCEWADVALPTDIKGNDMARIEMSELFSIGCLCVCSVAKIANC